MSADERYEPAELARILSEVFTALGEAWVNDAISTTPNIWRILEYGAGSYEIRYSRMLRWLLDPSENHGLGSRFLDNFVEATHPEVQISWHQPTARTEAIANGDILVEDCKTCLIIEHKMHAGEHWTSNGEHQLDKYARVAEARYRDHKLLFVYLTRRGEQPSEDPESHDAWRTLGYDQIRDILGGILNGSSLTNPSPPNVKDETRHIIQQFIDDLGRHLPVNEEASFALIEDKERFYRSLETCADALGLEDAEAHSEAGDKDLHEVVESEQHHATYFSEVKERLLFTPLGARVESESEWRKLFFKLLTLVDSRDDSRSTANVRRIVDYLYRRFSDDQRYPVEEWSKTLLVTTEARYTESLIQDLSHIGKAVYRKQTNGLNVEVRVAVDTDQGVYRMWGDKKGHFPLTFDYWHKKNPGANLIPELERLTGNTEHKARVWLRDPKSLADAIIKIIVAHAKENNISRIDTLP